MLTHLGDLGNETLIKNMSKVIRRVKDGSTTVEEELRFRHHEIGMIESYQTKKATTKKNNKRRTEYIWKEIFILKSLYKEDE